MVLLVVIRCCITLKLVFPHKKQYSEAATQRCSLIENTFRHGCSLLYIFRTLFFVRTPLVAASKCGAPFRKKIIAFLDRKHFTVQQKPVFCCCCYCCCCFCLFVCFFWYETFFWSTRSTFSCIINYFLLLCQHKVTFSATLACSCRHHFTFFAT